MNCYYYLAGIYDEKILKIIAAGKVNPPKASAMNRNFLTDVLGVNICQNEHSIKMHKNEVIIKSCNGELIMNNLNKNRI